MTLTKSLLFLIAVTIICCDFSHGQSKVSIGFNTMAGAKVYPIKYYNSLASMELGLTLQVENKLANRLGLLMNLNFVIDPARYKLASESTNGGKVFIGLTQRNISWTGMIVFPVKNENLKLLAGIGLDYNLATDASLIWTGQNVVNYSHNNSVLDSIQILFDQHRNKFLPSASLGLQVGIPGIEQLKFYLIFRQNLLNLFDENIPVYEISTGKTGQAATNYKPGYLKLGLGYEFKKRKDY